MRGNYKPYLPGIWLFGAIAYVIALLIFRDEKETVDAVFTIGIMISLPAFIIYKVVRWIRNKEYKR